jgi:hypothetical protein
VWRHKWDPQLSHAVACACKIRVRLHRYSRENVMLTSRNNAHMWSGWHELFFVTFFCFFFFLHAASGAGGGFSSAASSYILWDAILRVQCPPHQCVDDLGSHTCGWSAQGFLPYSKYDVNVLILYGRYQGPLATGHRLVGLRPATLSKK